MLAENVVSEQASYPLHFPLIGDGWFSTLSKYAYVVHGAAHWKKAHLHDAG